MYVCSLIYIYPHLSKIDRKEPQTSHTRSFLLLSNKFSIYVGMYVCKNALRNFIFMRECMYLRIYALYECIYLYSSCMHNALMNTCEPAPVFCIRILFCSDIFETTAAFSFNTSSNFVKISS
jgi:hypothetical protein